MAPEGHPLLAPHSESRVCPPPNEAAEGWQLGERGKARRGKFIYIAPLKHKAIQCFTKGRNPIFL